MKKIVSLLLLVLCLVVSCGDQNYPTSAFSQTNTSHPGGFSYSSGLYSIEILNTGAYPCDSSKRSSVWVNNTGKMIYIRSAMIWMGVDKDSVADICGSIERSSDGMVFIFYGQDAYANGRSPHQWSQNFAPDYIPLNSGDSLMTRYFCNGDGYKRGHHIARIWFLDEKP